MRTIIQNGTIVSDTAAFRADLLLEDGVVKAVGAGLSAPDAQVRLFATTFARKPRHSNQGDA